MQFLIDSGFNVIKIPNDREEAKNISGFFCRCNDEIIKYIIEAGVDVV